MKTVSEDTGGAGAGETATSATADPLPDAGVAGIPRKHGRVSISQGEELPAFILKAYYINGLLN